MQSSAALEKQKVLDNKVAVIRSSVQVIYTQDWCVVITIIGFYIYGMHV